jgi:hypothetical protein
VDTLLAPVQRLGLSRLVFTLLKVGANSISARLLPSRQAATNSLMAARIFASA